MKDRFATLFVIGAQSTAALAGLALAVHSCTVEAAAPDEYGFGPPAWTTVIDVENKEINFDAIMRVR